MANTDPYSGYGYYPNANPAPSGGSGMDPFSWAMTAKVGADFFQNLLGGGGGENFVPTEGISFGKTRLMGESPDEQLLAALQMAMIQSLYGSDFGSTGGIDINQIAQGQIPEASRRRIDDQAYGGLEEAGRRASVGATERAMGRGMGMSSIQETMQAEMMRPLVAQATQHAAALEQAELGRMNQLRQQALQNQMTIQQGALPMLQRLLQIRMAQPEHGQYQGQVRAGKGYFSQYRNYFGPDELQDELQDPSQVLPQTQTPATPYTGMTNEEFRREARRPENWNI